MYLQVVQMKISIIIPSYNQYSFLEKSLLSAIRQDYVEKEIFVMDGGSTDGSINIIKKYERDLKYWQSQPDGGQSAAISKGIELSTGEIVGWLNSDDILMPGAITRIARKAREINTTDAVFYGGNYIIDEQDTIQDAYLGCEIKKFIHYRLGPTICQPGTFFGRRIYDEVGGLNKELQYGMDYELWFKFMHAHVPFIYIRSIQSGFRRHPYQKGHSSIWLKKCLEERSQIKSTYGLSSKSKIEVSFAYILFQLYKILNGSTIYTVIYRLYNHHRLREYQTYYT